MKKVRNMNQNIDTKCIKNISFGKVPIDEKEIDAVSEVLKSGWLAHGPKTKEFEQKFAKLCNAKHAVAVNSATAALHLCLLSKGLGKGDEVIVPTQTHVATAHAVMYCGATPKFADVRIDNYNMDMESVKEQITDKTKAIIPVHFAGHPVEMNKLISIAKENNLFIIEDAAHSPLAKFNGKLIGSLDTDAACFSFYPVKHITTGEGGMVVTNDDKIAEDATLLRAFGIDRSTWLRTQTERPWIYHVTKIGYNFRMTEVGAAMGVSQLDKLQSLIKIRQKNANLYEKELKGTKAIKLPQIVGDIEHVYLFYQILIDNESAKTKRDELIQKLKDKGIGTSVHYPLPVPLMPIYREKFGYKEGDFPIGEKIAKEALSLPVHHGISSDDITFICDSIKELVE